MRKFAKVLPTKKVPFMGDEIEIRKLSAGAVKRIGAISNDQNISEEDKTLTIVLAVLNEGVVLEENEEALTLETLEEFPLDELNNLSMEIMAYAGVVLGEVGNVS